VHLDAVDLLILRGCDNLGDGGFVGVVEIAGGGHRQRLGVPTDDARDVAECDPRKRLKHAVQCDAEARGALGDLL
jgi:hypothetical protein